MKYLFFALLFVGILFTAGSLISGDNEDYQPLVFEPDDLSIDWEDHWSKPDTGRWTATYTINGGSSSTSNAFDSYANQVVYAQKIFRYGGQLGAVYINGPETIREKVHDVYVGSLTGGPASEMSELIEDFDPYKLYTDDSLYNDTFIGTWITSTAEKCGMVNDTMRLVQSASGGIARIKDDLSLVDCYVRTDGVISIPTEIAFTVPFVVSPEGHYIRGGSGCSFLLIPD